MSATESLYKSMVADGDDPEAPCPSKAVRDQNCRRLGPVHVQRGAQPLRRCIRIGRQQQHSILAAWPCIGPINPGVRHDMA